MKNMIVILGLVMCIVSGCVTMDGPRPPRNGFLEGNIQEQQRVINELVGNCKEQAPDVEVIMDPLTMYYMFEGENADKYKECLKTKHGWFELGPPEYGKGTMAPPR